MIEDNTLSSENTDMIINMKRVLEADLASLQKQKVNYSAGDHQNHPIILINRLNVLDVVPCK